MVRPSLSHFAAIIFMLAIPAIIPAQELKDRELKPAFDFTTIEMPVEITSIRLNGKNVVPGEKIKGDDDWLQGLSFTLQNVSDRPIAYVAVSLRFRTAKRATGFTLSYGPDYSRGEPRSGYSPLPIQPGQTVDLTLTKERYPNFLEILSLGENPRSFDVAPYLIELVCFEDDTNIFWEGGYLKRRSSSVLGNSDVIERYKLPVKPR
jgi:hypothetical protein